MPDSILIDRTVFEENFVPEKIIAREGQIKDLARCLKPVLSGDYTVNAYLYGNPGVGKTLICKTILEKYFPKQFVYVDCFEDSTKRDIMEQVIAQSGIFARGRPSTKDMIKRFKQSKKRFLLCIDRCELLREPEIIEVFILNGCGLILISNRPFSLSRLAFRANSKLYLDEIEFKPYGKEEIFQILKERVQYGLAPNSVDDRILSIVSGLADGDARRALQIVKLAARNAEILEQDRITIENTREAAKQTRVQVISTKIEKLTDKERIIFDILKDSGRMSSGELFRIFKELSNEEMTDRSYRNQMVRLRDLGLVRERGATKGKVYEVA